MKKKYDCNNPRCLHLATVKGWHCCIWCARPTETHPQRHTRDCEIRYEDEGRPSMRIFRVVK